MGHQYIDRNGELVEVSSDYVMTEEELLAEFKGAQKINPDMTLPTPDQLSDPEWRAGFRPGEVYHKLGQGGSGNQWENDYGKRKASGKWYHKGAVGDIYEFGQEWAPTIAAAVVTIVTGQPALGAAVGAAYGGGTNDWDVGSMIKGASGAWLPSALGGVKNLVTGAFGAETAMGFPAAMPEAVAAESAPILSTPAITAEGGGVGTAVKALGKEVGDKAGGFFSGVGDKAGEFFSGWEARDYILATGIGMNAWNAKEARDFYEEQAEISREHDRDMLEDEFDRRMEQLEFLHSPGPALSIKGAKNVFA
jgi:hypothetical protein